MRKLIVMANRCSGIGGAVASVFMVLIVLLIFTEIVLRTVFNVSTLISDEYSAYFFVVVVMAGLAMTLRDGGHIRITLVVNRMNPKAGKVLELVGYLMGMALCSFALYYSGLMAYDAYVLEMTADSISETPIWMPQVVIPLGLFLLNLQLMSGFLSRLSQKS